ncbi:porphobilinogen synthase [Solidesulfovibrio sp. C21]|uniref:porphobilinogen synthase n=1 Tax=Solidesulfovibrio sp. C21 TaxID=3398613 RepID=UPI0039FD8E54
MVFGDFHRGRRLRRTPFLRDMVRETELRPADLIQGYFVVDTDDRDFERPIASLPGQSQLSVERMTARVGAAMDNGLRSAIIFGLPEKKDPVGSGAYADDGIVQKAVMRLKETYPELVVVTDVCLCEYTSHGHCGLIDGRGEVQNDPTLELLAKTAVSHARAGADIVAPSDMMDGRVGAIRMALDEAGFTHIPVMSYAVKYASCFYGPFRDAADSTPAFGDRRGYQMDPANVREGLREAAADLSEGADILIVKPGMPYLDVLRLLRDNFDVPLAAYQVSGEYAMLQAAIGNGWLDGKGAILESLTSIKRAGADMIITYFAEKALPWLSK